MNGRLVQQAEETPNQRLKGGFLMFAATLVSLIALAYGVSPSWFVSTFLAGSVLDVNVSHILRAVMGLYLFLGAFWFYAATRPSLRNVALLTTILFAGGLVSGRLLSLLFDGLPSPLLLFYLGAELLLVPVALWIYKQPDHI